MPSLTVNGQPVDYRIDPATPLLWALRDASNLTGPKYGCGVGLCGACTVILDGEARRACQLPVGGIEGGVVTTIEALARDRSHPVQQAFVAEGALGCGFCQSGMILSVAALIAHTPEPTDADIDRALTNICRCGAYTRIRRAVHRAARAARGEEVIAAAPPPGIDPADAARAVPAMVAPRAARNGP